MVSRGHMDAFDRLPPAVRRRLADGPFNYDARAVARTGRRHGLSGAEIVAFIDALDAHSRSVLSRAVRIGGENRMHAPDPGETALVAAARSAGCGVAHRTHEPDAKKNMRKAFDR